MRIGKASHRKPEVQGNRRKLGEPGKPDGPEGTSGRRKPEAWPPEEPEGEQPARVGGSTKGITRGGAEGASWKFNRRLMSEGKRKAQAGSSTEGRDGGRDARRKLRESADGKP